MSHIIRQINDAETQRRTEDQMQGGLTDWMHRPAIGTSRLSLRLGVSALQLLLVVALILVLVPSVGAAEEPVCRSCHPDKVSGVSVHPSATAGECLGCHALVPGRRHPQMTASVQLVEGGTKLCKTCHSTFLAGRSVHNPVAAGECGACHEVHRSRFKKLLKSPVTELCVTCHHAAITGKVVHAPVAAGDCLGCHEPHHSSNRRLLKERGASLCFNCHRKSIAEGESVHQPVAEGDCMGCHTPHASAEKGLLVRHYAEGMYLPYRDDQYALCYGCHTPLLAQEERTLSRTAFRNGDLNLHAAHVNLPDHGRSCKVCHDPHASSQPSLLKRRITGYGRWEIPLSYTRGVAGGTCMVGCHKTRMYDRLSPVMNE